MDEKDPFRALRFYAGQITAGREGRDLEVQRLRRKIDPETGKPYSWGKLADAADMSRQGVKVIALRADQALPDPEKPGVRIDPLGE